MGLVTGGVISAKASISDALPDTSPAVLLAGIEQAKNQPFSGTVVTQMSLGLPQLSASPDEDQGATSVAALLSGTHTMRVWYGAPDRQRIALIGPSSESDVFHSGHDVWQWDSDNRVATHTVLSGDDAQEPMTAESLTPQQLTTFALGAVDATTKVSIGPNRTVADRPAYDLVLTPHDGVSRIESVHIAVDGSTKLPLAVEVFSRGNPTPAVDVAFSGITVKRPPSGNFRFMPPPGAAVRERDSAADGGEPHTVGSGWASVVVYQPGAEDALGLAATSALPAVRGTWGSGRLLDSNLLSVLFTEDGRILAGAVDPAALYSAAAANK